MAIDFCFYPNYVVVRKYNESFVISGITHYRWMEVRYYFNTKTINLPVQAGSGITTKEEYIVDNNTILDAVPNGSNTIIYYAIVSGSTITLGTSVYGRRILLSAKITEGSPVDTFDIKMWNTNTKQEEDLSIPTVLPCFPDYIFNIDVGDTPLSTQCIGYTQRKWTWIPSEEEISITDVLNSTSCGYTPPVENTQTTEELRIKVCEASCINPVFLVWKNTLGGWDSWLFSFSQEIDLTTTSDGRIEVPYFDLSSLESHTRDLGKNQTTLMTIGAMNLTRDQKNGIEKILVSPIVYQLNQDGSIMRYVKVIPGKFVSEPDTNQSTFSIEFTIELPETSVIK